MWDAAMRLHEAPFEFSFARTVRVDSMHNRQDR